MMSRMSSPSKMRIERSRRSSSRYASVIFIVCLAGGIATGLGVSRSAPTIATSPELVAEPARVARAVQDDPDASTSVPVISVNVTQYGFEAPERTLPAGTYLLVIRNATGEETLAMTVQGVAIATTETARTVVPAPGETIDLPVAVGTAGALVQPVSIGLGTVTIIEAGHPEWRLTITVE